MKKIIYALIYIFILTNFIYAQIAVNQIGYFPKSQKYVFFTTPVESYSIVNDKTYESVYQGKTELWKSNDPSTGHTVYRGDFSDFIKKGTYYIQTENIEKSMKFSIGNFVYDELYNKSLKSFYIQRCGIKLESKFAGEFAHDACHLNDGFYHSLTGKTGTRKVVGGWHDAGDYGKYIVNGAYSVAVMLTGYELFPAGFQSDNIGIPESGNNIPDYLDECQFELKWMLTMQDEDGGLFHKVTEKAFQTLDLKPNEDKKQQFIVIKTTTATADFAIVMAQAGRIYKQYDKKFAKKCKKSALKAWEYLENNPTIIPEGGFKNPEDIHTGQYGDLDDSDERFWAAVELYRTFKKKKFNNYILQNIKKLKLFPEEITWLQVSAFAAINYLKFTKGSECEETKNYIKQELHKFCEKMLAKRNNNGYQVLLNPGDYKWGSLQLALNAGFPLLVGAQEFNDDRYKEVALDQLNYVLGANGMNFSFVTGFGEKSATNVHNRICSLTDNWDIYPGFLVGGPNEDLQDDILKEQFINTTPGLCYIDTRDSYASNETCINWNAILVVYAGYMKGMH